MCTDGVYTVLVLKEWCVCVCVSESVGTCVSMCLALP
jgi:hypothetical protein